MTQTKWITLITVTSAIVLLFRGMDVKAAGIEDVFDAKYYAEQYSDLEEAFGDDEELLFNHFLEYGLKEGRTMSPVLDIQEYRAKYADLDKAFGDDWDAYVQHFFEYGINENRDNCTDFDVKAYVSAYDDIEKAFGNDYLAVTKHYLTFGRAENRVQASKSYVKPAPQISVNNSPTAGDLVPVVETE